ncbi:hypothetical protein U1Q18_027499 [Sarracenia purpurea var. burkii]
MDHSWRPRPPPPIQGNVCPTCSFSHFPFCSPPHPVSFNQNPKFFPHNNDHSFRRPFFDPFLDHPGPNVNLHRPFVGNPDDRFGDLRPWIRNPSLEYEQFHGNSQIGDSGMVNGGYGDGFSPRYDHRSAGFKRMRVDEIGPGSFVNDNLVNSSRVSFDHERRLKLIRDHGGFSGGTLQGEVNSVSGMGVDANREMEQYLQENSVFDTNFGSIDGVEHGRSDGLRGGRNDMTFQPPTNLEINGLKDSIFSDFDRKGIYFPPEPDFNPHNYEEEHDLAFPRRNSQNYGNEELCHTSNVTALYHEGGLRHNSDLRRRSPNAFYPASEVPRENYYHHSIKSLRPCGFFPEKESRYYHQTFRHHEQINSISTENCNSNHGIHSHGQLNDRRELYEEVNVPTHDRNQGPVGHQNMTKATNQHFNKQGGFSPILTGNSENMIAMQASRVINVQPPLPTSPPPPLPVDPSRHPLSEPRAFSSPSITSSSLFPIPVSSEATVPSSYAPIHEAHSLAQPYFHNKSHLNASSGIPTKESQNINWTSSVNYLGDGPTFSMISSDKPKVVDASHIFKQPHRATRPDHIVIILRGLPGSGKSYLAKILRDLEVENGGDAPRIHSMDDYFMTEVEKVEESDLSRSSNSVRGKKPVMKKVMEYCYEPEMEEAYRTSMLKAFKKTLDEGVFSFVIVDDRNLRVADFAQFWATAKRSGYEVYLLEAPYKDPVGCTARNVHGFTQDDIEKMAGQWEEAPSLYLKLNIKSLFQGDDLKESGIQEVDMDTEDGDSARIPPVLEGKNSEATVLPVQDYLSDDSPRYDKKWDAEGQNLREVKELGRSKWSDDLDDDNAKRTKSTEGNSNALSGLIKAYAKEGRSVHWGDQSDNTGFSIGGARKGNISLVIGPGCGYNLKSNPLSEDHFSTQNSGKPKGQSVFQERIRAERESFRAVFDKRRQRIGGFDTEEE